MRRALYLLLLALVAAPSAAAVDPFYRNRMEEGVRAFELGNWERAAHHLRIACFGHLDEPPTLALGLVRLAIAETQRGEEEAFRRIFARLLEVEERFSAYSSAPLPAELRQQFEGLAARLVPAEILRSSRSFESIAERAERQRLASLPPPERRAELEARLQAEPDRVEWRLDLARLELAVRRPQAALEWLDALPVAVAGVPPASCLRQQAASQAGNCSAMDLAQPFCRDVPDELVEFRLECLVEAGRWPEAAALLGGLDPLLRSRRRIARLERRVSQNFEGEIAQLEPAAAAAPATPPQAAPPQAAQAPAPPAPVELAGLRRRLSAANGRDELATLLAEAERLADANPDSRQTRLLAAEIAYLQSDWPAAVRHFARAGALGAGEAHLAFYRAVALFETGDRAAAAEVLRPVISRLQRTSFVDAYIDRILAPGI